MVRSESSDSDQRPSPRSENGREPVLRGQSSDPVPELRRILKTWESALGFRFECDGEHVFNEGRRMFTMGIIGIVTEWNENLSLREKF